MKRELIVRKTIKLNASVSEVWEALTNPEITKKYMFGSEVVSDWKVGSSLEWKGMSEGKEVVYVKGNIVEIVQGRLLQFTTFDPNSRLEDIPSNYTTVKYELSRENDHTVLSITQGDFAEIADGEKRHNDTVKGWDFALKGLKDLLEA
jgi:uncharacterized protein YndB with AHSA1/START domain